MSQALSPRIAPSPTDSAGSASKLHLLDLAQLKQRLGARWCRLSVHVERFFESAIQRSLGPGDSYTRMDELSYVVLFRDLSEAEAQMKCETVLRDVCQRLFGEHGMQVKMRSLVAHLTTADLPDDLVPGKALDALLEKRGKETVFPSGRREWKPEQNRVSLRLKSGAGTPAYETVAATEIDYLYRPVWDTHKHVVVLYLCQPVPKGRAWDNENLASFCTAETEEDQATLDLMVLRECEARASNLHQRGARIMVAMPLAFTTLVRGRFWTQFGQTYRDIPPKVARDLAVLVFGIDPGVPGVRLAQELPKLKATAHKVFCLEDKDAINPGVRFNATGARALGLSLTPEDDEVEAAERLEKLAKQARGSGAETFVLGVRTTSLALRAMAAGVRYMEGLAIRQPCRDPQHAFAQSVEYLYSQKLAKA